MLPLPIMLEVAVERHRNGAHHDTPTRGHRNPMMVELNHVVLTQNAERFEFR
jgi:hypothetical protein